jgi:transcriptional regulator EpsA
MSDSKIINQVAMERVLHVLEESLKVYGRSQFYCWAQGALQGLLPHQLLLCIYGDLSSFRFKYNSFSCMLEDQKIVEKLADPVDGMLAGIIDTWLKSGRQPLCYSAGASESDPVTDRLRRIGCGHALAHGARDISGNEGSFFLLLQMPDAPQSRHSYLLDLVMPHLHMALYRMLRESDFGTRDAAAQRVLSKREAEVLRWVGQGKTNHEIAWLLDLSPLTVKNHVQKILRKLGVSNRAQAVSKAHAAHLIRTGSPARARSGVALRAPEMIAHPHESD